MFGHPPNGRTGRCSRHGGGSASNGVRAGRDPSKCLLSRSAIGKRWATSEEESAAPRPLLPYALETAARQTAVRR